jgi:hypothetical protein
VLDQPPIKKAKSSVGQELFNFSFVGRHTNPIGMQKWLVSHHPDINTEATLHAVAKGHWNLAKHLDRKKKGDAPVTTWRCIKPLIQKETSL